MSWLPSNDPVLGDPKSCDALELVIVPRTRDLGDGFEVRRALPHGKRQMVGPFIFFDHFGPVQFMSGKGMDVRPHPHIGLATVTYLFDGSIMHRDSEGNIQEIQPGAMNLMTAGRGIAHSERTPGRAAPRRPEDARPAKLDRAAGRIRGNRAVVPALRRRRPADGGRARLHRAHHRRQFVRRDVAGDDGVAVVLHRGDRASRASACRSIPIMKSARSIVIDGEIEIAGERYRGAAAADLPARRSHHGEDARARRG